MGLPEHPFDATAEEQREVTPDGEAKHHGLGDTLSDRVVLLSRRPGQVSQIIAPHIDRTASPEDIRRDRAYLDTVEEIWQGLRQYVT